MAALCQTVGVVLFTSVLCVVLLGTWHVGALTAAALQICLFPFSVKNWESILK
jgi:hypothetical protein